MLDGKRTVGVWLTSLLLGSALMISGCDEAPEQEETEAEEQVDSEAEEEVQQDEEGAEEGTLEAAVAEIEGLESEGERPEWLVRTWQAEVFGVGAGLGPSYHFFEDGLFVFNAGGGKNTCEPGVRARVGTWEVDGDDLVLWEQRRIDEVGGEKVDDPIDGCTLEGSEEEVTVFDEPEEKRLAITDCPDEEIEDHASEVEELGVECREFSGDIHWTVAAGADSWRQEWKDWMERALEE